MSTIIDYTDIRSASIMLHSLQTSNFDIAWKSYYDETNNFKKLHIKDREDFNVDIRKNFILGGFCHDKSAVIDENEIFSGIVTQKNMREIKFKHIANGELLDILKSTNLNIFLKNIIGLPLYLHYQAFNPLYFSLVDIVDSMIDSQNKGHEKYFLANRTLKATIYDVLKNNIENMKGMIKHYGYPNIKKNDVQPFILDLIMLTKDSLKKSTYMAEQRRLSLLLELLENSVGKDELVFLSNEDEYILVKKLHEVYKQNIYMFIYSEHIFDNESDVQGSFIDTEMRYQNKKIETFAFVDSESSILVQASDIVMGTIGKLFSFLRSSEMNTLEQVVLGLNDIQSENLELLLTIYNKALNLNPALINNIESDSELAKFTNLNVIKGFA